MTTWKGRLRLALYACLLLAIVVVKLTTVPRTTDQPPSAPPSTSSSPFAQSGPIPRIAIAYDVAGRGSVGFNALAWEGTKRAADEFGAELQEITAGPDDTDADREERLSKLADARDYPILVVGSSYAAALPSRPEVPWLLVRHSRRRHRGCAKCDRHPVQRGAGLLPGRRGAALRRRRATSGSSARPRPR